MMPGRPNINFNSGDEMQNWLEAKAEIDNVLQIRQEHSDYWDKVRGRNKRMDFIRELWNFLRERKKLWLAPIIIVMVILGKLLVLSQG